MTASGIAIAAVVATAVVARRRIGAAVAWACSGLVMDAPDDWGVEVPLSQIRNISSPTEGRPVVGMGILAATDDAFLARVLARAGTRGSDGDGWSPRRLHTFDRGLATSLGRDLPVRSMTGMGGKQSDRFQSEDAPKLTSAPSGCPQGSARNRNDKDLILSRRRYQQPVQIAVRIARLSRMSAVVRRIEVPRR